MRYLYVKRAGKQNGGLTNRKFSGKRFKKAVAVSEYLPLEDFPSRRHEASGAIHFKRVV